MKCARQTRTILIIVILFKFVTSNIFRFRYIIAALRRLPNPLIRRRRRRHRPRANRFVTLNYY